MALLLQRSSRFLRRVQGKMKPLATVQELRLRTFCSQRISFLNNPKAAEIRESLERHDFAFETNCLDSASLEAWAPFFSDAKPDPWGDGVVYKRSSYLAVTNDGDVQILPPAPLTQSKEYNKSSQGGAVRMYEDLDQELVGRNDFQNLVNKWVAAHDIEPMEPILAVTIQARFDPFMAVDADEDGRVTREEFEAKTARKDFDSVDEDGNGYITKAEYLAVTQSDPLTGQGCHRDGMQAVSVFVITRENVEGGGSVVFADHAATRKLAGGELSPGQAVHLRDLNVYHDVTPVSPIDNSKAMTRSVFVLLARFQEESWIEGLKRNYSNCNIRKGMGKIEALFKKLDSDGSGSISLVEFIEGAKKEPTVIHGFEDAIAAFHDIDTNKDGMITKVEFEAALAAYCSHPQGRAHYW